MLQLFLQMLTSTLNTLISKAKIPTKKQKVAKHLLNMYQQLDKVINSYDTFLIFLTAYHDKKKSSPRFEHVNDRVDLETTRYDGFLPVTVIYNVTDKSITKHQLVSEFSRLVAALHEYAEYLNFVMGFKVFDVSLFEGLQYLYEEEAPILSAWFNLLQHDEAEFKRNGTIRKLMAISNTDPKYYFFAHNISESTAFRRISLDDKEEIHELCERGGIQLAAVKKSKEELGEFIKNNFSMDDLFN